MSDMYYIGSNIFAFSLALIFAFIVQLLIKKIKKGSHESSYSLNLYFAIGMILLSMTGLGGNDLALPGWLTLVVQVILFLINKKDDKVEKRDYYTWATGLISIISGIYVMCDYSTWSYCELVVLGILWIVVRVYLKEYKLWKLTSLRIYTTAVFAIGLIMWVVGYCDWNFSAHVYTDESETYISKKTVELTGTATPDTKVKVYLDGEHYDDVYADEDGYFSYKADTVGKYKFVVKYEGETDYDTTQVKASKAYKKRLLKRINTNFYNTYLTLGKDCEDFGNNALNTWDEGSEDPDSIYKRLQDENKDKIEKMQEKMWELQFNIKVIKSLDKEAYAEYKKYYEDMYKFYNVSIDPAGSLDDVEDEFGDLDTQVASNSRMMRVEE
ncbi:hypothetical protein FC40_GL000355 [Ligilactobacillus hayakitensis DSM 18933 = JCM 14209]|uniref:Uncharacterized protein n=1 Tax=Ligilactobacillus hayakitensis DSM 18933 = JCM 14209 TaxID=1423755 RepID=A0A0R1WU96_9LACO|nr:hypothetical protein [Ligilactobacillus hayakitensis]KRM19273.1 hypothetical protein FC40_GL000355 [Ligilactobacillus hayakitensis DSM 18933 = JCM 14209]